MRKSRLRGGVTGPEPTASRRWSQGLNLSNEIPSSLRQRAPLLGRRRGSQRGLLRGGDRDYSHMHISATPLPPRKQGHRPAGPHLVPSAQRRPWRRSRGLGDFDEGMRKGHSLWPQSWPHPGPRCQTFLPTRTTHYQPCSGTPGTSPMSGPAPQGPGRGWSSKVRIGPCWGWPLPSG